MACFVAFVGFIWVSVSSALESFLQNSATEALTWLRNWGAERVLGEATRDHVILQPPNSPRSIVSVDGVLSEFYRFLENEDCKIIGIYGMGGIGKTTLLREINNQFFGTRSGRFDLVIFVEVTRDIHVDLIQKDILDRLRLDKESSRPRDTIFNALREKRFLLLLDNLWSKLELGEIGIPVFPHSKQGSKIAFTTRSSEVCNDMGAARWKLRMPLLSPESSWELFCQSLGLREDQWTKSTTDIAKEVASKCDGLPLALITVGRAMADVTNSREWDAALVTLRGTAVGLRNMEERVLRNLKFSFDRLRDEHHKECLLYWSLFPENYNINVPELIEYWIGEGLLEEGDGPCSIDTARDCGLRVITALKASCLLQDLYDKSYVRLHDVVRKMALWITSGKCEGEKKVFLVNSGDQLERAAMPERWTDSTRISLMWNSIQELPQMVRCPNLRTLLLSWNDPLSEIQDGFFLYMPILTVLDLSRTGLKLLPPEITLLAELRFLDLSWTPLESLPREVGGLTKLRLLNLNGTKNLKRIPPEAISSLLFLQSLTTFNGEFNWRVGWKDDGDDGGAERCVCLKDLPQLDELGLDITFHSQADLQALLDSRRLCSVIVFLHMSLVENSSSLDLCQFLGAIRNVRLLHVDSCVHLNELIFPANQLTKLEGLQLTCLPLQTISWKNGNAPVSQPTQGASFKNLEFLTIENCWALEEVTWTKELPCLQLIWLSNCPKMVEMIVIHESVMKGADQTSDSCFPKLESIILSGMENLKSICGQYLLFPALDKVLVTDCPELKKLPFGLNSANNIQIISVIGPRANDIEWDSEAIRSKFTPYLYVTRT